LDRPPWLLPSAFVGGPPASSLDEHNNFDRLMAGNSWFRCLLRPDPLPPPFPGWGAKNRHAGFKTFRPIVRFPPYLRLPHQQIRVSPAFDIPTAGVSGLPPCCLEALVLSPFSFLSFPPANYVSPFFFPPLHVISLALRPCLYRSLFPRAPRHQLLRFYIPFPCIRITPTAQFVLSFPPSSVTPPPRDWTAPNPLDRLV